MNIDSIMADTFSPLIQNFTDGMNWLHFKNHLHLKWFGCTSHVKMGIPDKVSAESCYKVQGFWSIFVNEECLMKWHANLDNQYVPSSNANNHLPPLIYIFEADS